MKKAITESAPVKATPATSIVPLNQEAVVEETATLDGLIAAHADAWREIRSNLRQQEKCGGGFDHPEIRELEKRFSAANDKRGRIEKQIAKTPSATLAEERRKAAFFLGLSKRGEDIERHQKSMLKSLIPQQAGHKTTDDTATVAGVTLDTLIEREKVLRGEMAHIEAKSNECASGSPELAAYDDAHSALASKYGFFVGQIAGYPCKTMAEIHQKAALLISLAQLGDDLDCYVLPLLASMLARDTTGQDDEEARRAATIDFAKTTGERLDAVAQATAALDDAAFTAYTEAYHAVNGWKYCE